MRSTARIDDNVSIVVPNTCGLHNIDECEQLAATELNCIRAIPIGTAVKCNRYVCAIIGVNSLIQLRNCWFNCIIYQSDIVDALVIHCVVFVPITGASIHVPTGVLDG